MGRTCEFLLQMENAEEKRRPQFLNKNRRLSRSPTVYAYPRFGKSCQVPRQATINFVDLGGNRNKGTFTLE
jgi:hypothetical protein